MTNDHLRIMCQLARPLAHDFTWCSVREMVNYDMLPIVQDRATAPWVAIKWGSL